jgi:hypothetical protein
VLDRLAQADEGNDASPELIDGLRAQYLTRHRHLEAQDDAEPDQRIAARDDRALRRELIALQRATLAELRRAGEIGITTQRVIEHELDLEDARLGRP